MTTIRNRRLNAGIAVTGMVLALAFPASAQTVQRPSTDDAGAAALLFSCRAIEDDRERLACFDREVGALQEAQASDKVVIVEQEVILKARRDLFGFTLPRIALFRGPGDKAGKEEEEIKEVNETLASFRVEPTGRVLITLTNGGRWIQTDNVPVLGEPKAGDMVRIESASLGSFIASIGGRRAIRVKRLN